MLLPLLLRARNSPRASSDQTRLCSLPGGLARVPIWQECLVPPCDNVCDGYPVLQLLVGLVLSTYYPLRSTIPASPSPQRLFAWVQSFVAAATPSTLTARSTFTTLTFTALSARAPLARLVDTPNYVQTVVSQTLRQVRVVEHKRSKQLYALKYIDKAKCIKQKAVANIIQERRLLEEVRATARDPSICLTIARADRPPFHSQSSLRFPG